MPVSGSCIIACLRWGVLSRRGPGGVGGEAGVISGLPVVEALPIPAGRSREGGALVVRDPGGGQDGVTGVLHVRGGPLIGQRRRLERQGAAGRALSPGGRWWITRTVEVGAVSAGITDADLDRAPFRDRGGVDGALRDLGANRAGALLEELNAELTA